MNCFIERQKLFDRSLPELLGDSLLVAGAGINRIPVRFMLSGERKGRVVDVQVHVNRFFVLLPCGYSFATSPTGANAMYPYSFQTDKDKLRLFYVTQSYCDPFPFAPFEPFAPFDRPCEDPFDGIHG